MATHNAVVVTAKRTPLSLAQLETPVPVDDQVKIRVDWATTAPIDLHRADGGILINPPDVLGSSLAGTVIETGPEVTDLAPGDPVFGFGWRNRMEHAQQEIAVRPRWQVSKRPPNVRAQDSAVVSDSLVTVFHTVTHELGLPLPWPLPQDYAPENASKPILIWGGSSGVGQYAVQVLSLYGYRNLIVTASKQHHQTLKGLGASAVFDYRDPGVADAIIAEGQKSQDMSSENPVVPFILDCIGSKDHSLAVISRIAQAGSRVAVMLPFIIRDASIDEEPVLGYDASEIASWVQGVDVRGVRTHFYHENVGHAATNL